MVFFNWNDLSVLGYVCNVMLVIQNHLLAVVSHVRGRFVSLRFVGLLLSLVASLWQNCRRRVVVLNLVHVLVKSPLALVDQLRAPVLVKSPLDLDLALVDQLRAPVLEGNLHVGLLVNPVTQNHPVALGRGLGSVLEDVMFVTSNAGPQNRVGALVLREAVIRFVSNAILNRAVPGGVMRAM